MSGSRELSMLRTEGLVDRSVPPLVALNTMHSFITSDMTGRGLRRCYMQVGITLSYTIDTERVIQHGVVGGWV